MERCRLYSLQVLRGVAATAVVFSHAVSRMDREFPEAAAGSFLSHNLNLSGAGHIGVDIFFVISGFVMMTAHSDDFAQPGAGWTFMRRRVVRIAPIYWLMTTLGLLLLLFAPSLFSYLSAADPLWVLGSYAFVPVTSAEGVAAPILGVGWTLNFEMFFYLVFGGLMFAPRRIAVPALTVAALAAVTAGLIFQPQNPVLQMMTSALMLEFVMGVLMACAFVRYRRIFRDSAPILVLVFAAGFAFGLVRNPADGLERLLVWGIPSAALVAATLALTVERRGPMSRSLIAFGDASYSVYLVQVFALPGLALILSAVGWRWHDGGIVLLTCGTALAGMVVTRFVEQPISEALQGNSALSAHPRLRPGSA